MSLEASLAKIRPHTSSSLAHQKAPANLLIAIESTLTDQKSEKLPTAYFAVLVTTLESSKSNASFGDGDLLPAILYLFALVAPHVPHPVIRSHLSTVLSLLAPLFPPLVPHAPPLRSQLSLFSAIIQALDVSQLDSTAIRQSFTFILDLTLDPRPKVRKKAAEVVRDVLAAPPPPLSRHPYSDRVVEWSNSTLTNVSSGAGSFDKKGSKAERNDAPETGIHLIAMLKPIVVDLPNSRLAELVPILLSLPRLGNPYLAQSSYTLLSNLISDTTGLDTLVSTLLGSAPAKSDNAQAAAWLDLLRTAFAATATPFNTDKDFEFGFKAVFAYLEAPQLVTRTSAARALAGILTNCVPTRLVEEAVMEHGQKNPKSSLAKIIAHIRTSFEALPYARAMPQMLFVLGALLPTLRHRSGPTTPTAAEILLLDFVQKIGELRIKKAFEHKEVADEVLKIAMGVLGPEVIFRVLPLGLIPEDRERSGEPNAYLLPLLTVPHPTPLGHFVGYFVPLSERMFDLQQAAESRGRGHEAKMWEVLVAQVWAGLVGYCWGTRDLVKSFNPAFAQLLSQVLYNQPALRPAVLKALKITVESNAALASDSRPAWANSDTISSADATHNIIHLRSQAESWFAVLFNVFGTVDRDARGAVGEVIAVWAQIAGDEEVTKMYKRIVELLEQNFKKMGAPDVVLTAQELLILLLPMLPDAECMSLWTLCTSDAVLGSTDAGVQKRGYRTLARLAQGGKLVGVLDGEAVLKQLESHTDALLAQAKRERIILLTLLLPLLPPTSLHIIPNLIPEAVLGTKEPAERTRLAAFELIVAMGRKMQEGGIVTRSRVSGMMEEDGFGVSEVQASVEEYMTMIAAGLAGATPHMISASVTAISRLVFEFKEKISPGMLDELLGTLLVFVGSANREIVKAALGFIKLAVHTLPLEIVTPHLQQLVPALLEWVGDHKNHFKVKVRHIFERMIRRFGWDAVYACVGNEAEEKERGKVLLNIKKRKDRAKRKKAQRVEEEEDDDNRPIRSKTGDAFEDVLYGSESEIEDSDEDDAADHPLTRLRHPSRGEKRGARLRVDDDEPMDLLHGAADNLTNAARRRKPGYDASHFKTDDETGRMIIDGDQVDDSDIKGDDIAGAAYKDAITSVDGFTRGTRGRVKFNKDTKKRRRNNEEDNGGGHDVEMADAVVATQPTNKKRKREARLGHEFKAKNAGGDVKKGGMDPYAYMPLSRASKKNGKGSNINVIGRR